MKNAETNPVGTSKTEVLITTSEPIIKRIDLINNGRDGVKVTHSYVMTRNGVANIVEAPDTHKRPCQRELRSLFQQLRKHLLATAGYYWTNQTVLDMLSENVNVTYCLVTHQQDQFQIGGKVKTLGGGYTFPLNAPLVKNEDYDDYAELSEILNSIKLETTLFMKGIKGADSKLVVIDYMTTKREMADAENAFAKMTKEEQDAMMREAFEDSGLTISEENGEMVVSVAEEVLAPSGKAPVKLKKVETPIVIELDEPTKEASDDDFEIPAFEPTDTKTKKK